MFSAVKGACTACNTASKTCVRLRADFKQAHLAYGSNGAFCRLSSGIVLRGTALQGMLIECLGQAATLQ